MDTICLENFWLYLMKVVSQGYRAFLFGRGANIAAAA
jgi:hypothetical protein